MRSLPFGDREEQIGVLTNSETHNEFHVIVEPPNLDHVGCQIDVGSRLCIEIESPGTHLLVLQPC